MTVEVGNEIPKFTAKDFEGHPITREDFLGSPFVIYFYPKDDTPGCTKEACEFRDFMNSFDDVDVMVIGVSRDNAESHRKFMEKHQLNFPLITDENGEMAKKFGVIDAKGNYIRSTFLCDEDGTIIWVESPVEVEGHVARLLEAIEESFN